MSATSVVNINDWTLDKNTIDFLISKGKEYILFKKFYIGNDVDYLKIKRVSRLSRIVTIEECLLDRDIDCLKQKLNKEVK